MDGNGGFGWIGGGDGLGVVGRLGEGEGGEGETETEAEVQGAKERGCGVGLAVENRWMTW